MMQGHGKAQTPRPLLFGEVLYDSFPDGSLVLGGAPFNVAWHLRGFGLAPLLVSRVGDDSLGERVLAAMIEWGLDTSGMQKDPHHPTGRVLVSFKEREPSFQIIPGQAYDFIDAGAAEGLLRDGRYQLLYHGSLIARSPSARAALNMFRDARLPLFVDINLRDPWWSRPWLDDALHRARWAKLNEQELRVVSNGNDASEPDLRTRAERLRQTYGLELLLVTRGQAGAIASAEGAAAASAPGAHSAIVDTVGAGDAFSAAAILGLLHGWPLAQLVERAGDFATSVCLIRGAIGHDRDLYRRHLRTWRQ
jgi:fructokinase